MILPFQSTLIRKITIYRITIILERACIDRQGTDFHPECIQFHAQILVTRKLEKGVWKRKHKFDLARKLVSFFGYLRPCVLLPLHLFPCHLFPYPDSCQQLLVSSFPRPRPIREEEKGEDEPESTETSIEISSKRSIDRVHKFGVQLVRANCLSISLEWRRFSIVSYTFLSQFYFFPLLISISFSPLDPIHSSSLFLFSFFYETPSSLLYDRKIPPILLSLSSRSFFHVCPSVIFPSPRFYDRLNAFSSHGKFSGGLIHSYLDLSCLFFRRWNILLWVFSFFFWDHSIYSNIDNKTLSIFFKYFLDIKIAQRKSKGTI